MSKNIIYLKASWCSPCKVLTPIVKSLEDIDIEILDVDLNEKIAKGYGVKSVPTLIFFKDDVEVKRLKGIQSKESILENYNSL